MDRTAASASSGPACQGRQASPELRLYDFCSRQKSFCIVGFSLVTNSCERTPPSSLFALSEISEFRIYLFPAEATSSSRTFSGDVASENTTIRGDPCRQRRDDRAR